MQYGCVYLLSLAPSLESWQSAEASKFLHQPLLSGFGGNINVKRFERGFTRSNLLGELEMIVMRDGEVDSWKY